jgi:outer membrane lipoprotein carrier protein
MKQLFLSLVFCTLSFASFDDINSFKADFTQSVTDEKNKILTYEGSIVASRPQNAMWNYAKPIKKEVFISLNNITIIEPEIEQVIVRNVESHFDFFNMIKNAKKIKEDTYTATYKESIFTITTKNALIKSISYVDEFDNKVKIVFKNQKQNERIDEQIFTPNIPLDYDIIQD